MFSLRCGLACYLLVELIASARLRISVSVAQDGEIAVATRRLLSLFVGVPDEMLRSIGLIVVLSSRLDHVRMQTLKQRTKSQ